MRSSGFPGCNTRILPSLTRFISNHGMRAVSGCDMTLCAVVILTCFRKYETCCSAANYQVGAKIEIAVLTWYFYFLIDSPVYGAIA